MKQTKSRVGEVLFCFTHLTEPHSIEGSTSKPKYSTNILISKQDKEDMKTIEKEYQKALERGVQQYGVGFKNRATPLHRPVGSNNGLLIDCDQDPRYQSDPHMQGCYMLCLKASTQPSVMAKECGFRELSKEEISQYVYSGCVGFVTFDFYPYSTNGFSGIGAGLGNVLKTRDGDFMGGRGTATSDFSDLFEDDDHDDFSDLM